MGILSLTNNMKDPSKQKVDPNSDFDQGIREKATLSGAQDPDKVCTVLPIGLQALRLTPRLVLVRT